LLAAIGGLAPVFPLMALPVVPPPSTTASAGVGLATAAAAAAAREGWRHGGMMTETYFSDLTAGVGMATITLESVTATVIDLYTYWKPGFRIKLEALLSSSLSAGGFGFNRPGYKD